MHFGPSVSLHGKRKWRLASRVALLMGTLLLGGGTWLCFSRAQSQEVTRVSALEPIDLSRFHELPAGADVLLEGRLVAREPVGPQGFVVYTEEYYLRRESEGASRGRDRWGERALPRPRIALEQRDHVVEVCNKDYLMLRLAHEWQSDQALRSGDLAHEATLRRRGFKAGDALTIDGRVAAGDAGSCIAASAVSGGDRLAYIDAQRAGVVVLRVVGAVFAGFGVLLLVIGALLRRSVVKTSHRIPLR